VAASLPSDFPAPVILLQHRASTRLDWLPQLVRRYSALPAHLAEEGDPLTTPGIRVVPGGSGATMTTRGLHLSPPEAGAPCDALLSSMAAYAGSSGCAVILSGLLTDGARGAVAVKAAGGRVLVQDPATARAPSMPRATCATGAVDFVLVPRLIGKALVALAMAPGAADLFRVPPAPWALYGA
jgi:two-component system chemotaxis response regulator CheB